MKILSIRLGNIADKGWQFPEVQFKNINLLVGETASGKSTLLNWMFFLAVKIVHDQGGMFGFFHLRFEHNGIMYGWEMEARQNEELGADIYKEKLLNLGNPSAPIILIERDGEAIKVNGTSVPPMAKTSTCIYLFREAPNIKEAHEGFKLLWRRDFSADELNRACVIQSLPKKTLDTLTKNKSLFHAQGVDLNLSNRLFLLKNIFPDTFAKVIAGYREIFPFIETFEFKDMAETAAMGLPGRAPYLHLKDKNTTELFPMSSLSSGMKKVLLILADVVMLPSGSVYLLDEYENSLGINAINFLPSLISQYGRGNQFIITSHHPYLINNIPVENWIIFHRKGFEVSIKQGDSLVESYGKSKQQSFIKLINDPFFTNGG